jgi:hypothetical protein
MLAQENDHELPTNHHANADRSIAYSQRDFIKVSGSCERSATHYGDRATDYGIGRLHVHIGESEATHFDDNCLLWVRT